MAGDAHAPAGMRGDPATDGGDVIAARSGAGCVAARRMSALLLLVMFLGFILQIVFRYVFNFPLGWTDELSVVLGSGWCCGARPSWCAKSEEVRFDIFYGAVGRAARAASCAVITGIALIVAVTASSLPAVVDYVTFMKVERTAYLKIRFDWLYSIYVVFVVAVIVRYAAGSLARRCAARRRTSPDRPRRAPAL